MAEFEIGRTGARQPPPSEESRFARVFSGRRRQALTALIAIGALAGFGAIVVYSYDRGRQAGLSGIAPVIQAADGPTRIRPADPGGMRVPDRDKQVFSRINPSEDRPRVERLLPPPQTVTERPPPMPALEPPPRMDDAALRALTAEPAAGPETAERLTEPPKPPPSPPSSASPPPPAPTSTPGKSAASPPPPPAAAPVKPAPGAAATPPPKMAAAGAGRGWRVQIAAFRSEAAVRRSWADFSRRHRDLFSGLELSIARVDLGPGKGVYYRMRAGPLADAAAAAAMCRRLKQRKLGCFIVKP